MAIDWDKLLLSGIETIGSTLIGKSATDKAAKREADAAKAASGRVEQEVARVEDLYAPWREAGINALGHLERMSTPGGMTPEQLAAHIKGTPGYQFQSDEIMKAIDRRHAATGDRFSGRGFKEMGRWVDDYLLKPGYDRRWNELAALAGYGPNATGSTAQVRLGGVDALNQLGLGAAGIKAQQADSTGALYANAFQNIMDDVYRSMR